MLDQRDLKLLERVAQGLPICARPYFEIGLDCGLPEAEVIERIAYLKQQGLIKRMGVIVKHRAVGYRANAMVVWNIPDERVQELGVKISQFAFVNLCYQRPRLPEWNYNLYCMIHGKDRDTVLEQLQLLNNTCALSGFEQQVLFSRRCFKQRGAVYRINVL